MKTHSSFLLWFMLTTSATALAAPNLEFNGVLVADGATTVALVDRDTGNAAWVALGHTFEGYTVTAYHPGKLNPTTGQSTPDTVVLSRAGSNQPVTLQIKAEGIQPAPEFDPLADPYIWGADDGLDEE